MQIRIIEKESFTILEICGDNGQPAKAGNPIDKAELASVQFPEANGKLAIVSGMPMFAAVAVGLHYKNLFSAIGVADPRDGTVVIAHSVSPNYKLGDLIPL